MIELQLRKTMFDLSKNTDYTYEEFFPQLRKLLFTLGGT